MDAWQPTMSWETAQLRSKVLSRIRSFFNVRDIIEVETPVMARSTITDVHLDALTSTYDYLERGSQKYYFQTSPEYLMKRLLADGYGDIYQVTKAFRNEPFGRHHNPEFTMLEWYRLNYDHVSLMDEVEALLTCVLNTKAAVRMTYQEAFLKYLDLDPLESSFEECIALLKSNDKCDAWLVETNDLDIVLQFIFTELIEVHLGIEEPCFIYNFPASQASLARLDEIDKRVANRFECYYKGIELANGFYELSDEKIQRQRFEQDNIARKNMGLPERQIDELFMSSLKSGLPQCAGVALGIDRFIMLAGNLTSIKEVISFPINRA